MFRMVHDQRKRRSLIMLTLLGHELWSLLVGGCLGIGAIGSGIQHWEEAREAGRNPLSAPYVQGAAPVAMFAILVMAIFAYKMMIGVRRAILMNRQVTLHEDISAGAQLGARQMPPNGPPGRR
jgi:hypothetical protein